MAFSLWTVHFIYHTYEEAIAAVLPHPQFTSPIRLLVVIKNLSNVLFLDSLACMVVEKPRNKFDIWLFLNYHGVTPGGGGALNFFLMGVCHTGFQK